MNMSYSPPRALRGFEHINRYWDRQSNSWAAKILPGEVYVTREPNEVICTTLGSCVSACIRDPVSGIGGMNHFMLPMTDEMTSHSWMSQAARYGSYAMEHLINEIMKAGGRRENLEMKVAGGARVIQTMSNKVGQCNIDFILDYASIENITLAAQDLGDIFPRKIMYYPGSGRMRIKRLRSLHNDTLIRRENSYASELQSEVNAGKVELF